MDDLPFLSTFLRIYETGNLTRAATALHKTQPTVSYQLGRLEEAVGAHLFLRRSPGLVPTPLGERLYVMARGFGREIESLVTEGAVPNRRLELASVSAFGRYVLYPILAEPDLGVGELKLCFPNQEEVIRLVLEGRVDAGFVYRAPVDARIESIPAYEETLELVANPSWVRRLRRPSDAKELPLITYEDGDYVLGRWFGHHFGRRVPPWSSVAHFEEIEEVLGWVAEGRGLAIVPGFCVKAPAARGRLRPVRWGRPPLVNTVYAARLRGALSHPVVNRLLERFHIKGS